MQFTTTFGIFLGLVLAAAAGARAAESATGRVFRAGAATSNITPPLGIVINCGMQNRTATHVHDELHARCLVLDDGTTTLAFVVIDSCVIDRRVFDGAKKLIHEAVGLPLANMTMSATHAHSCGPLADVHQSKADPEYQNFVIRRVADGVRRALTNLAPARIAWGHADVPDQVNNRRWKMKAGTVPPNPFGVRESVMMNPASGSPNLIEPAGPIDPQVCFISVRSIDNRPIALFGNYSLHYVGGVPEGDLSADYFGVFADRIQQLLGADRQDPPFVGIMSNGTSGDINNTDFRRARAPQPPYGRIRIVADELASAVAKVEKTLRYRDWVQLGVVEDEVELGVRHPTPSELAHAREVLAKAKPIPPGIDPKAGSGPAAVVQRWGLPRDEKYALEALNVANLPPSIHAPLKVIQIGDLRVFTMPFEAFCAIGVELKSRHPGSFSVCLANAYHGYVPTPEDFRVGGYETWRALSSYLEVEASTKVLARLGQLADRLK